MKRITYLDYHATTPLDPRVLVAMNPYFANIFGNPSSRTHRFGWEAEEAVEKARAQVAALLGAAPAEIVFTSGATEANNLALKGTAESLAAKGNHIITAATEHLSVLAACRHLEQLGARLTILPTSSDGLIDLDQLEAAITPHTILISIMRANNEIGVLQPVDQIGRIAEEYGIPFHSDATQGLASLETDVLRSKIDLLSLSAHKLYGPKGVGALCVRGDKISGKLQAQMHGGGQERGIRSGTLNVPGIVGLGEACGLALKLRKEEASRLARQRDRLHHALTTALDGIRINGSMDHRLPNNLNVSFEDVDGESLLMRLSDLAVSNGSACSSNRHRPSHVLKAIGLPEHLADSTLRFGLGRFNTDAEIDLACSRLIETIHDLRSHHAPKPVPAPARSFALGR